jgi:adenine deaminase
MMMGCVCHAPPSHRSTRNLCDAANPARLLKLRGKGRLGAGADADLLVLSHDTLKLRYVFAKGVMRKSPQWTQVRSYSCK